MAVEIERDLTSLRTLWALELTVFGEIGGSKMRPGTIELLAVVYINILIRAGTNTQKLKITITLNLWPLARLY